MEKDIQRLLDYAKECKTWSGRVSGELVSRGMKQRLESVNNQSLNCFDKLRHLFTEASYNLGKFNFDNGEKYREEEISEQISFNFTFKLINSIIKFDVMNKGKDKTIYTRSTNGYEAILVVEQFVMDLKIYKDGKLFLHRACGDSIFIKEYRATQIPVMIKKSEELGILGFGDGGRGDIIEYHYEIEDDKFLDVWNKFKALLIEKGVVRYVRNRQRGKWTFKHDDNVIILHKTSYNITMQELKEVAIMFNDFLKEEGYTEKYEEKW